MGGRAVGSAVPRQARRLGGTRSRRAVFILEPARGTGTPGTASAVSTPSLWWLCAGILHRPRQSARVIAELDTHRQARMALGGFALLYSVAALTSFVTGRRPQHSPLMRFVPPERYYMWESLFEPPVTVAWMTLFTALVRNGARRLGGAGTFRSDFDVLALAHTTPLVAAMWLPDMTCYLLRLDEQRYRRMVAVYAPAATAWALATCIVGIHETEQLSWPKAAVTVLIADAGSALASGIPLVMR